MSARSILSRASTSSLIAGATLWTLAGGRAESIDDAFILLVYVRRLRALAPPEWNVGDGPVEGFTSTLDLLLKTLTSLVEPDLVRASFLATMGSAVGSALLAGWIGARLARERACADAPEPGASEGDAQSWSGAGALVGGLMIGTSAELADASAYLLETPVVVAVTLVALSMVLLRGPAPRTREIWASSAALGALALARPETSVIALLLAGAWAGGSASARSGTPDGDVRRWAPLLATATVVLAQLALRWAIFGELAPNTYFAKSSASRWLEVQDGLGYLAAFLARPAGQLLAGALVVGALALPSRAAGWFVSSEAHRRVRVCWLACALWVVAVVVGGGDCYGGARFWVAPVAIATVGCACAWAGLRRETAGYVGGALLALLATQLAALAEGSADRRTRLSEWPLSTASYGCDQTLVRVITESWPDAVVAQSDFQRFKLFSDHTRVLDLHGLNDRTIAHRAVEGRVRHGKYDAELASHTDADVWIWGYRYFRECPIAEHALGTVLADPGLAEAFSGYPERPGPEARARMEARFTTASVSVCGGFYNFLVRRNLPVPARDDLLVHRDAAVPDAGACIDAGELEARAWLVEGWSGDERDVERSFVWSDGPAATLRWGALPAGRRFTLVLEASGIVGTSGRIVQVEPSFDGAAGARFPLPVGWAAHEIAVPEGARGVVLRFDHTVRPSADARSLALQLDRACLVPVQDAGATGG